MSTLQTGSPVHHRYATPCRRSADVVRASRTCNVRAPRSRRHARVQRVCSFVEGEAHVRTDPSNRRLGGAPVARARGRAPAPVTARVGVAAMF